MTISAKHWTDVKERPTKTIAIQAPIRAIGNVLTGAALSNSSNSSSNNSNSSNSNSSNSNSNNSSKRNKARYHRGTLILALGNGFCFNRPL